MALPPVQKKYSWLIQTPAGAFTSVPDGPLPEFTSALGSGTGEQRIVLPRTWTAAGFPGDARGSDELVLSITGGSKVYCFFVDENTNALAGGTLWGDWTWGSSTWGDPPASAGQLIWSGEIEEITPRLSATQDDIEILALPAHRCISDGQFISTITFTDTDPVDAAYHFFQQGFLPGILWDGRNVRSGRTITQTFEYQSFRAIFDFLTTACGAGWCNAVDERNRFRLWKPDTTKADHTVLVGRELTAALYTRSRMAQKNRVTVRWKGGTPVTAQAPEWTQMITRDAIYNFPDVTDAATAYLLAQTLLQQLDSLTLRAKITVVSNSNGLAAQAITYPGGIVIDGSLNPTSTRGYVLESIRPGDTLKLGLDSGAPNAWLWGDASWGTMRWGSGQVGVLTDPQVIQNVVYHGGDTVECDLSSPRPQLVASHQKIASLVESALAQNVT